MRRLIARVVVAAGLAATAYAALPTAPASAATCPTADGVSVVVDFHELGGGVQTACVPDGGGDRASDLFPAAGFPLDYVQRQPGFVCRVSGKPADNPCVNTPPADAYWSLWWSDGKSGRWTYSTTSVGGLTIPDGGYVAFSWNGSDESAPPGTSPAPHPEPSPTPQATTRPTRHPQPTRQPDPTEQPSGSSGATTAPSGDAPPASESASASGPARPGTPAETGRPGRPGKPGQSRSASPSASPSDTGSASPSDAATVLPASSDPPDAGDDGLPAWVAPAVVVVLFGAAGAVALVRRRRAGTA